MYFFVKKSDVKTDGIVRAGDKIRMKPWLFASPRPRPETTCSAAISQLIS